MANKLRDEDLHLNIIVNGDKGKKELGDLEKSTRDLTNRNKELRAEKDKLIRAGKQETEEFKKITSEITANNKTIKTNEARMTELRKEIGLTGLTMRQLRTEQTRLKRLMDSATPGTPQWKQYRAELIKVEAQMGKVTAGAKASHFSMGKMADGFTRYFALATVWIASVTGVILGFKKAATAFAEFDDQVADVQKTTKLSRDEVLELDESLQKIDTRSSQEELLGLSRIAGKLGKDNIEDLEGFVRATDQVNVALNEDLGGDIEETIRKLGKLMDIFGVEKEFGTEQAILKVGSAINALGAASTANEEYLVEFTNRVAGVAPGANISIDKVLGLGATLDQLAQTAEVSSTVVAQVIPDMFKDTEAYARIANVSVKDFAEVLNRDANEAFIMFLEGLNSNNGGLEEMVGKLDGLGLEGRRSVNVLTVLGKNTNKLREQQALANLEFEKGTSLTEEFNIKNNTRQAQLEKARKNLNLITRELGESLSPAVLLSTNGVTYFIKAMVILIRFTREYYPIILGTATAITTYYLATKTAAYWDNIHYGYIVAKEAITKAYAYTTGVLTGKIKLATVAQRIWNTAQKASPIGLVAGLVAGAIVALIAYSKKINSVSAAQKALNDVEKTAQQNIVEQKSNVELLLMAAKNEKRSLEERKAALAELNRISPEYFGNLTLEKINSQEATIATENYTKALLKQARVQAAKEKLVELEKDRIDSTLDGSDKQLKWYQKLWSYSNIYTIQKTKEQMAVNNAAKAEAEYLEQVKKLTGIIDNDRTVPIVPNTSNDIDDDNTDPNLDLIAAKEKELELANKMPRSTEDEIAARNKAIETIERQIARLNELGTSKQGESGDKNADAIAKKRLEILEANYNKEQALIRQNFLQGIVTEDQFNTDLLKAQLKFLADKLKIYKAGSKEYQEAVNQAMELEVAADRKMKDLLLAAQQELANAKIENFSDEFAKQEAFEVQRWETEKAALQKRLIVKDELSKDEIALNDSINKIIEQKEATHQEKMDKLKAGKNLGDLENMVAAAAPVDPNFATPDQQKAFFDARMALIEAQYAREKKAAKNNQSALLAAEKKYKQDSFQVKSDQIDAEYALVQTRVDTAQYYISMLSSVVEQESALGKALFLFQQALAVGQIWINVAIANAKAVAASPLTFGQPWVTINTVMGGVSTAMVLAQTVARFSKKGKKDGGFADKTQSDDEVAGVYHGNEWIASAPAVRNPVVRKFINIFDEAQRKGSIKTLDMNTIMQSIGNSVPSQKSGGFASSPGYNFPPSSSKDGVVSGSYSDPELKQLMQLVIQMTKEIRENPPRLPIDQFERERKKYIDIQQTKGL